MSDQWHGYRARWHGVEYDARPEQRDEGLVVHLVQDHPGPGFEDLGDDRHVRATPVAECEVLTFFTVVCTWRGASCQVHDERADGALLLEYVGGSVIDARNLGFDRVDRGVWQRWVARDEARGRREDTVLLIRPGD